MLLKKTKQDKATLHSYCESGIHTANFLDLTVFQKRPSCWKAMHEAKREYKEYKLSELNPLDLKWLIRSPPKTKTNKQ